MGMWNKKISKTILCLMTLGALSATHVDAKSMSSGFSSSSSSSSSYSSSSSSSKGFSSKPSQKSSDSQMTKSLASDAAQKKAIAEYKRKESSDYASNSGSKPIQSGYSSSPPQQTIVYNQSNGSSGSMMNSLFWYFLGRSESHQSPTVIYNNTNPTVQTVQSSNQVGQASTTQSPLIRHQEPEEIVVTVIKWLMTFFGVVILIGAVIYLFSMLKPKKSNYKL